MSGGHFDYKQYTMSYIADQIEHVIDNNCSDNDRSYNLSAETIEEFKRAVEYLNIAQVYVQRIDWLLSGDDSETTFHTRLHNDLEKIKKLDK